MQVNSGVAKAQQPLNFCAVEEKEEEAEIALQGMARQKKQALILFICAHFLYLRRLPDGY